MNRKGKIITLHFLGVFLLTACGVRTIRGSGEVIVEDRDVSGFDQVILAGLGEVFITQGDEESLTIETDDNLMEYIESEVRGGKLYLEFAQNTNLDPTDTIKYRLNVVNLVGIESSGVGSFSIQSLDTQSFDIAFSGAGKIVVDSLTAGELSIEIRGTGDIELAGEVDSQAITISGAGRYRAPDLKSNVAEVRIAGVGSVIMWVVDSLDVKIEGGGQVDYFSSPVVTKDIEGGGKVQGLGEK
jgi:hypothetical protein